MDLTASGIRQSPDKAVEVCLGIVLFRDSRLILSI